MLILDAALQMKRKHKIVSQCGLQRDHSGSLDFTECLERNHIYSVFFGTIVLNCASYGMFVLGGIENPRETGHFISFLLDLFHVYCACSQLGENSPLLEVPGFPGSL